MKKHYELIKTYWQKIVKRFFVNKFITILVIIISIPLIIFVFSLIFKLTLNEAKENIKDGLGFSTRKDDKKNNDKFNNAKPQNSSVIVDQIEWKVLDSKNFKNNVFSSIDEDYCKANDGDSLIYIKYSLRNADRSFLTVPKYNLELYDSDENIYKTSVKTYKCVLESTKLVDRYAPDILNREEEKTYEVLYEVPKDKRDFRLKVGDLSLLGKDFEYIKINL